MGVEKETKNFVVDYLNRLGEIGSNSDVVNNVEAMNKLIFGINYLEAILWTYLDENKYHPEQCTSDYDRFFYKLRELSRVARNKGWIAPYTYQATTEGIHFDEEKEAFVFDE